MLKKIYLPAGRQVTKSYKQTQKLGEELAKEFLLSQVSLKTAVVLGLKGNLGGGKTTFLQGFAKGLGINEKILSPTFVIMKKFKILVNCPHIIDDRSKCEYRNFYHFDCYRFNKSEDVLELGWKEIISNPKNIVAVEWPEKIKKFLPKKTIFINFKFLDKNRREVIFD